MGKRQREKGRKMAYVTDIEEEPVKSGSSNPLAPALNTAATAPPPRTAARTWEGEDEDESHSRRRPTF
jgi:hypothetical protein